MTQPNFLADVKPFIQANWEKANFQEPTAIQLKSIPHILEGKDVIAESPTGTGKTLAYVLPLLNNLDPNKKNAQVVILAPSRELVMQIFEEIKKWSEGSGITSASFIGGANIKRQVEKLKKSPQVIVGTPGRIQELIKLKKLKMHAVKSIVLDEGDQLLTPEHKNTIQDIIKTTLNERQVVLFSATLNVSTESKARDLMKKDPEVLKVGLDEIPVGDVKHVYLVCEQREKVTLLERMAKTVRMKALGFVKDIGNLNVLAEKLEFKGVDLHLLHSDTRKEEREAALKSLRNDSQGLLLATDVAARGLDIVGLTHVIHFDLPANISQYVHRSGRTGRQGASGTVVSIVTEREERELKKLAKELNITLIKNQLYKGELVEA
ncbi:DEAD/DEAH box helicase [Metabacillus rhizolycopersici]|uniref:DEAD/DEAH box helicase n=1 Tax=Metabacillus rhizolycopersici TaxID=2875709 RepID=A0ABS7UTG2_9BACI|nr:DEAD/DEAH box helicase [Metabacillus rhizolycopersici]MBZ5751224.1 DEAD/DEAH box helicase [Metabacillus rhizolycopersici]